MDLRNMTADERLERLEVMDPINDLYEKGHVTKISRGDTVYMSHLSTDHRRGYEIGDIGEVVDILQRATSASLVVLMITGACAGSFVMLHEPDDSDILHFEAVVYDGKMILSPRQDAP